jgi:hypothetical protein
MTTSQSVRVMTSQGMVLDMAMTPGVPADGEHDATQEASLMDGVDRHPWGPTEPDELAVLDRLYGYDVRTGTYTSHVGD